MFGKTIGTLLIGPKTGVGDAVEVFAGVLEVDQPREVLVKKVRGWITRDLALLDKVDKRADELSRVRHPRLVRVLEYMDGDERLFICEAAKDTSILAFMAALKARRLRLGVATILHLSRQLCAALSSLHDGGNIVHGGVRPEAVRLTRGGMLRLGEQALLPSSLMVPPGARRSSVTARAAYLAPEQVGPQPRLSKVTPATDLYSAASVIYFMVTGQVLYPGKSHLEAAFLIRRSDVREALMAVQARVPGLGGVLARCLSVDPADRIPHALALDAELARLQQRLGVANGVDELAAVFTALGVKQVAAKAPAEPAGASEALRFGGAKAPSGTLHGRDAVGPFRPQDMMFALGPPPAAV